MVIGKLDQNLGFLISTVHSPLSTTPSYQDSSLKLYGPEGHPLEQPYPIGQLLAMRGYLKLN